MGLPTECPCRKFQPSLIKISNRKAEIEKLKQIKNNMHYSQYNQLAP
jgi:hypothetical protein